MMLDSDIRKIKRTAALGPFLYLPWYWAMQYLYPGTWNPLWPRVVLSILMAALFLHVVFRPEQKKQSVIFFETIFFLVVVHHVVMAFYNESIPVYRYALFMLTVMSGAMMMSLRSYVWLVLVALAGKLLVLFRSPADLNFEIFELFVWLFIFIMLGYLVRSIFRGRAEIRELGQKASEAALSAETARASKIEAEKRLLENDIELAASVQMMLLPKTNHIQKGNLEIASCFLPASRAGGDWWWFSEMSPGRYRLLMADVTGHGAGAAMVTALLAGSCQTMAKTEPNISTERLLNVLNLVITESCEEKHWVSFLALEIDLNRNKVQSWAMAAPEFFHSKKSDTSTSLKVGAQEPSSYLGKGQFFFDSFSFEFSPGDQLMIFTDGIFELTTTDGQALGMRRLKNIFDKSKLQSDLQKQVLEILGSVQSMRQSPALEDDLTLAVIQYRG